jgi:Transposase zinc-binding domain
LRERLTSYGRREPENTKLHLLVRTHWKTYLAELSARDDGGALPGRVTGEFERYLRCGILAHGFARVRCPECKEELLVGFSCKGRGFCPSCTTRRMQGTATHLLDYVLPQVPYRQWVLSMPRWLRFLLARDPRRITKALKIFLNAVHG